RAADKAPRGHSPAEGNTSSSGAFPGMPATPQLAADQRGVTGRAVGTTVDDEVVKAVLALQPWVQTRPEPERFGAALRAVLEAEVCRRGAPDPVTGALHLSALTQGALLKPEYDLSVHAHAGWSVGAVIADVKEMIHVNQEAGFPAGDRFLRTVA